VIALARCYKREVEVTVITRAIDQIIPPVYHHNKESFVNRSLRLVAALGMLALPSLSQAQTATTGSIAATATIQTLFAFGTASPLSFGTVTPGTAATATGYIPMQRNVGVIYTLPDGATTGQLVKGANTLQPAYTCGIGTTSAAITTSFTNCNTTAAQFTASSATVTGVVNEFVIFNGSLTAAQTNTVPGLYSGTIHILATPN
jgi:hypothetical protein